MTYMNNLLEESKSDDSDGVGVIAVSFGHWFDRSDKCIVFYFREEITGRVLKSKQKSELGAVAG